MTELWLETSPSGYQYLIYCIDNKYHVIEDNGHVSLDCFFFGEMVQL